MNIDNVQKYNKLRNIINKSIEKIDETFNKLQEISSKDDLTFYPQKLSQGLIDKYDDIKIKYKNKNKLNIINIFYNKNYKLIKRDLMYLLEFYEIINDIITKYNRDLIQKNHGLIGKINQLHNNQSSDVTAHTTLTQSQTAVQTASNDEQKAQNAVSNATTIVNSTRNALRIANQNVNNARVDVDNAQTRVNDTSVACRATTRILRDATNAKKIAKDVFNRAQNILQIAQDRERALPRIPAALAPLPLGASRSDR